MARVDALTIEKHITIPLRDGVITRADLYRPAKDGAYPTVVVRIPYDKEVHPSRMPLLPSYIKLAERGYAVVVQDTRGRFASGGDFYPFTHEADDGYDTVEWAAAQPWSNGSVGLTGASFFGATTLLGAMAAPPHLRCAIPIVTSDDYYLDWCYEGGALKLGFIAPWAAGLVAAGFARPDSAPAREVQRNFLRAIAPAERMLEAWPVSTIPGMADRDLAGFWHDWLAHSRRDAYWDTISPARRHGTMTTPMLHIGGWYDVFLAGTIRNFTGMAQAGIAPQKLIVGPWAHTAHERFLGDLDMGAAAPVAGSGTIADVNRWFDRYLGPKPDADTGPAVRYYLMGANRWCAAGSWPPAPAVRQRWYLHSRGRANSVHGDGLLDQELPVTDEADDHFLYNPARPVPTAGGNTLTSFLRPGPLLQDAVERRDDVLVYTSAPLPHDLVLAGPVTVRLSAATDGRDTDWTAKLCDVCPDGRSYVVCDGIIRARFRESFEQAVLLTPGTVYAYNIDLASTAITFKQGHRLRVQISSSNFPKFDRNSNTGGDISFEPSWRVAVQRVSHSRDHQSFLEVWQLPGVPE